MSHPWDASRNRSYYYRYCYYYYYYYYHLAKHQFGSSGQSERGTFQAPNHSGPGSYFSGFAVSTVNNPGLFPQRLNPPVPYNAKQSMVPFGNIFDQSRNLYVTRAREGVRHQTLNHGSQFANTLRWDILPSTSPVEPFYSDAWRSTTFEVENGSSTQFLNPPETFMPEQSMVSLKTETNESVNLYVAKEEVEHQTLSWSSQFTNTHGEEILPSTSTVKPSYPETRRPKTSDVRSRNSNQSIDPPVTSMTKHEMVPSEMETDESVNLYVVKEEVEHQALGNDSQFSNSQTEEILPSTSTVEPSYPETSRPKTSDVRRGNSNQSIDPPVTNMTKHEMVPSDMETDESINLYVASKEVEHQALGNGSQFSNSQTEEMLSSKSTVEPSYPETSRPKTSDVGSGNGNQSMDPPVTNMTKHEMVQSEMETDGSVSQHVASKEVKHQALGNGSLFTNTHEEEILPSTSTMEPSYPDTSRPKTSDVRSGNSNQSIDPPVTNMTKHEMVPSEMETDESVNLYVASKEVEHQALGNGSQFSNSQTEEMLSSKSTVEPSYPETSRPKTSDVGSGNGNQSMDPPVTNMTKHEMVQSEMETDGSVSHQVASKEVEHQALGNGSLFTNTHGEEILPSTNTVEPSYPDTSRPKTSDVRSGNGNQSIDPPVTNMTKHEMVQSEMETDESVNLYVASKEVEHQALGSGSQFSNSQTEEMLSSKSTVEPSYPETSRPKASDGDGGSSTLSWFHICKTQSENLFTQCDSSALSDFPDTSDSRVYLSTVRQHGSQSNHGFDSCNDLQPDKPTPSDESHSPQDFQDTIVDILQHFGLEKGDLQYFLSYPEDQINSDNLPHILNQIHLQKQNKAAPCPDPQPVKVCSGMDSSSSTTECGKSLGNIPSNTLKGSEVIESLGHTGNESLAGTDSESTSRGTTRGSGRHLSQFVAPGISSYKEPMHHITSEGKTSAVVSSQNQNGSASSFRSMKNSVVPPVSDTTSQLQTQPSQSPKRTLFPVLPSDIKSPPVELCWSGTFDNKFPPLVKMYDGAEATAMVFPHVCLLCNTECDTMTDWLTHQETLLHLENCKVLRRQFPEWDGELKPVRVPDNNQSCSRNPRSSSRSHGPARRHNKRRSSSISRSRSRHRGSESKSRRSSPSYESRFPSRSKDQKQSSPRRSRDLRLSPESSTPERSRLTSPERLVKRLLLSSGVESLSQHSDLEAFVKTLTPALMSELTKQMLTPSSSSAVRPGHEETEVRLRGIHASHSYKDVVNTLEVFGKTKSVRLHRDRREAIVVFRKEEDAEKLRSTKYFNLKGQTVDVVTEIFC